MNEELPIEQRPVVYQIPGMDTIEVVRDLRYISDQDDQALLDVYRPAGGAELPRPGVLFIHGGPTGPGRDLRQSGQYRSWGALAAASGMVGIVVNHRFNVPEDLEGSAQRVVAALTYIRAQADQFGLDPERLCLWACSGGGPHISFALREPPAHVRALVLYYPFLDLRQAPHLHGVEPSVLERHSAVLQMNVAPPFPILVVRAGRDHPGLNAIIDAFVARALTLNARLELLNHPSGQHAFDILDNTHESQRCIRRTLDFLADHTGLSSVG